MAKKELFEILSDEFLSLTAERYPTPEKVIKSAVRMGFRDAPGQITVISQFRDAIRGCSPILYRNPEHRNDLLASIIEALESLEDEMEELEEEELEEDEEGVT